MDLENLIRNKLQELEAMQDYEVSTDTVRAWIDLWHEETNQPQPESGQSLVGRNVRIVKEINWHEFEIGQEAIITRFLKEEDTVPYKVSTEKDFWYLSREEFELI